MVNINGYYYMDLYGYYIWLLYMVIINGYYYRMVIINCLYRTSTVNIYVNILGIMLMMVHNNYWLVVQ